MVTPIACSSLHNEDEPILDYYVDPYAIFEKFENDISIIIDGGQGQIEPSTVIDCLEEKPYTIRLGAGKLKL